MSTQSFTLTIPILAFLVFNCAKDHNTLYREALDLKSKGKYDQSLEKLKKAATLKDTPEVNKEIANYYLEYSHDYDSAEKFLKKSLELNPDYPNAIHNMGLLYLKKYEDSLENIANYSFLLTANDWFKKNMKQNPDFALTFAEYGMVLFYQKHYSEALSQISVSIQKGANKSYAHLLMGKIYFFGLKDYPQALINFNIAYNDFNTDSYLLRMLALTYKNMNDVEKARQFYARYIKSLQDKGAPESLVKKAQDEESGL